MFQTTQKDGWMDVEMMKYWLEKCYVKRPDGFFRSKKALLIMDSMQPGLVPSIKEIFKSQNSLPVIIPGGLKKFLQFLDIGVNRSFKAYLHAQGEQWMTNGIHSFTSSGHMRRVTFIEIINGFTKHGKA